MDIEKIKQLRQESGISLAECKKALEESQGDLERAKEILRERGIEISAKKSERETKEGIVSAYIHPNKKVGAMIILGCESDFVAKSDDFQKLAHELCLQIAASPFEETPLLEQAWIKDDKKTIKDLINEYIAKFGENITLKDFIRYKI